MSVTEMFLFAESFLVLCRYSRDGVGIPVMGSLAECTFIHPLSSLLMVYLTPENTLNAFALPPWLSLSLCSLAKIHRLRQEAENEIMCDCAILPLCSYVEKQHIKQCKYSF